MAALSPWMWFVGLFGLALLTFTFPNPIMILILLLGGYETYKRWKQRKAGGDEVERLLQGQAVAPLDDRRRLPRADRRLRRRHGADARRAQHPVLTPVRAQAR